MSGDHNMYQKPRSYDDDTQYDESQVQAMIKKAVRDERLDLLNSIEEMRGNEQDRNEMFSEGYDYALHHMAQLIEGREKRDGKNAG